MSSIRVDDYDRYEITTDDNKRITICEYNITSNFKLDVPVDELAEILNDIAADVDAGLLNEVFAFVAEHHMEDDDDEQDNDEEEEEVEVEDDDDDTDPETITLDDTGTTVEKGEVLYQGETRVKILCESKFGGVMVMHGPGDAKWLKQDIADMLESGELVRESEPSADENESELDTEELVAMTDGGVETESESVFTDTPAIRVEGDEVQIYDDALDAEMAVRDGEIPALAVTWRHVSGIGVDRASQLEVSDIEQRIDDEIATGEYKSVEEATVAAVDEIDTDEINSTGTYLFDCANGTQMEFDSAVELRAHACKHNIENVYHEDEHGRIQKNDGQGYRHWKLIGNIEIAGLAQKIRDAENSEQSPLAWAMYESEIKSLLDERTVDADGSGIHELIRGGLSTAEAVDFHMVVNKGWTQTEWANERGCSQQSVSKNIRKAREKR